MPCYSMSSVLCVSIKMIWTATLEHCRRKIFVGALAVVHTLITVCSWTAQYLVRSIEPPRPTTQVTYLKLQMLKLQMFWRSCCFAHHCSWILLLMLSHSVQCSWCSDVLIRNIVFLMRRWRREQLLMDLLLRHDGKATWMFYIYVFTV